MSEIKDLMQTLHYCQAELNKHLRSKKAADEHILKAERDIREVTGKILSRVITLEVVDCLTPEHDYVSCHDQNLFNYQGRCARCTLLHALKQGGWKNVSLKVTVYYNEGSQNAD